MGARHGEQVCALLGGIAFVELAPPVLERALEPFPAPVRTLDALTWRPSTSSGRGQPVELAIYDRRLLGAARALRFPIRKL
jgi:hypothetical protein